MWFFFSPVAVMHKTNIFYGLNEKRERGRSGTAPLRCFLNQIPLSIGLPTKHLWKVRNWSNKLQREPLLWWLDGMFNSKDSSSSNAFLHLGSRAKDSFSDSAIFILLLTLSSLLSVLPALTWPYYQSYLPDHPSDWVCKDVDWDLLVF
jgi:hypothetical protein